MKQWAKYLNIAWLEQCCIKKADNCVVSWRQFLVGSNSGFRIEFKNTCHSDCELVWKVKEHCPHV